jgi:hypothetical protein
MAICNALSAGLDKSCDTNAGGVNKIFIGDFEHLDRATITISGGEIVDMRKIITDEAQVDTVGQEITISGNFTGQLISGDTIIYQYWTGFGPTLTSNLAKGTINTISFATGVTTITITQTIPSALPTELGYLYLAPVFYEFKTNKNVCNFTETAAVDMANGTTFFNQVVTLVLSKRETTKRNAIEKLAAGQKQLAIVVLDTNGNYWLFGLTEGAYLTATEGGSGTAKADANGYTLTFTAMEIIQAYEIDPTGGGTNPIGIYLT